MGGRAFGQEINCSDSGVRRDKTLKLLSLITCGLKSKLLLPEFHTFVSNFDIVGFQESKTDSLDTLNLPNFKLICKHRKHVAKRKSGGIVLAYKTHLDKWLLLLNNQYSGKTLP